MVRVERALLEDAGLFSALEQAPDTRDYILPYSPGEHTERMHDPNLVYLRILEDGRLAGFFILAIDPDRESIEFRRIVVSVKGRGIGQLAIGAMERFCREELHRSRVWLDVFEHNRRGRHIYEKLRYEKFGEGEHQGRRLWLYQKELNAARPEEKPLA